MEPEILRRFIRAVPFEPFFVRTISGKTIAVPHPEFIMLTPGGRRAFIATGPDKVEHLDVVLIEAIIGSGGPLAA